MAESVADKINTLIEERWRGRVRLPGNAAIAREIRRETGLSISTGYLWMLRTGQRGKTDGGQRYGRSSGTSGK